MRKITRADAVKVIGLVVFIVLAILFILGCAYAYACDGIIWQLQSGYHQERAALRQYRARTLELKEREIEILRELSGTAEDADYRSQFINREK